MDAPSTALRDVAKAVRADGTLLSHHLRDPREPAALGALASAGPRAEGAEAEYGFVIEAIREGYLLHYGEPRVLGGIDPDLALLAGDHLYALGLECLSGLGDLDAVRELGDLISLCAQLHGDGDADADLAGALWLAATVALAAGGSEDFARAKAALRSGDGDARDALVAAATAGAAAGGVTSELAQAANSIDFAIPDSPARG